MNEVLDRISDRKERRAPENVIAHDVADLYTAIQKNVTVAMYVIQGGTPRRDGATYLEIPGYGDIELIVRAKKDAQRVIFQPDRLFVPRGYPISLESSRKAKDVRREAERIIHLVQQAVIFDAKAQFMQSIGDKTDKRKAGVLNLKADVAYMQAFVEKHFGLALSTHALSTLETADAKTASKFWRYLKVELEQAELDGKALTDDGVNDIIQNLRRDLGIGIVDPWQGNKEVPKRVTRTGGVSIDVLGYPVHFQDISQMPSDSVPVPARRTYSALILGLEVVGLTAALAACAPFQQFETPSPGSIDVTEEVLAQTETATPEEGMVGVVNTPAGQDVETEVSPTSTSDSSDFVGWEPPSLDQAKAGSGGAISQDIQDQMDIFEGMAEGKIPGAASFESSWNGGIDDDYRLVTYARSSNGNILWSTNEDGFFNEYPIYWEYDEQGNIIVVEGQSFSEIPDSEDAYVVFTGNQGKTGKGEKPVLVKNIIQLSDGTSVFELYWDYLANEWKVNPNLPAPEDPLANAPEGTTGFDEETGEPIRVVEYENGQNIEFHLNEQGEWVSLRGEFPLIDNGQWEYVTYSIYAKDSVLSAKYIPEFSHPDSIDDNNRPITSRIKAMFIDRLGLTPSDPEYYRLINEEMDKGQESSAVLPLITSDGVETFVRLSNVNRIELKISDALELAELHQEGRAIKWNDETGAEFYLRVIVDEHNNAICSAASVQPLDSLSDRQMRNFLFSCISHIFSQEDQRDPLNFSNTQVLADVSKKTVPGSKKSDFEIHLP